MKPTNTLATSQAPDGSTLVLQEHDGEFFMRIDGTALMSTTACASEQTMAELGCEAMEPSAPHVLIGGLGFGFTLRRVLQLVPEKAQVVVAELLPVILQWNREFLAEVNGALLDDERVTVKQIDVYDVLTQCPARGYDAILLDVDNSPDPLVQDGNVRLYSNRGLRIVQAALAKHGKVVFWSANEDSKFEKSLGKVFRNVHAVPAKAYPQAKRFTHMLYVAGN